MQWFMIAALPLMMRYNNEKAYMATCFKSYNPQAFIEAVKSS